MEFIVYTPEGFTTGPNTNVDVSNCQVLGFIDADSEAHAIKKLFELNDWIHKAGFTMENALALPILTDYNR